jgi:RNA polymerase sigma factor (sigma-70 family)
MKATLQTVSPLISSGMPESPAPRRKWALTQAAFDKLLASFGEDRESAAERYLEICRNLVRFFEWRGCPFPEDHADETINRVAKRLGEGEEIRNPSSYCMGAARMLLLEINKERAREQQALGEMGSSPQVTAPDDSGFEEHLECLRECLQNLPAESRELIIEYYQGDKGAKIENRKRMVERYGVPVNTLRMRALRIRERLQRCVENCQKQCNSNCANKSFSALVSSAENTRDHRG